MSEKSTPTDSELDILKVLWKQGPSTVQEVQDNLSKDSGYTTVLKFLQIMHEKGFVDRQKEGRAHRYRAIVEQEETQRSMLGQFADRLFGGSIRKLVQHAVTSDELKQKDRDEIQRLLEELKSDSK